MTDGATYLEQRGLGEIGREFGLRYLSDRNAIEIPYHSALGPTGYSRLRLLGEGGPKYLSGKGTARHLYNVIDSAKSPVFLCEGEFDALSMKTLGLNAVGVPGARTFLEEWSWLFEDVDVVIMFDGDEDGRKYGAAIARVIHKRANDVRSLHKQMPDGKDVNDMLIEGTLEKFLKDQLA